MLKCLNIKIREKGVTLVELLTAVTIFVIAIGTVSGLFVSGIRSQRRILAIQELLDQASYTLEYMGRTLRMAKKDLNGTCITAGYNYQSTSNSIRFVDYQDNCTEFFLENQQIKKKDIMSGITWELTSPKIQVTSFKIDLSGEAQPPTDYLQPKITFSLELLGRKVEGQPKIQVQTSISQRALDVQY